MFVFSDGAYEIVRKDGSMLSFDQFIDHLAERTRTGTDDPKVTLAYLEQVRGAPTYEDDLALVEISF